MKYFFIILILCSWAHGLVGMDKKPKRPKSSLTNPKTGNHQSRRNWRPQSRARPSKPYSVFGAHQGKKPVFRSQRNQKSSELPFMVSKGKPFGSESLQPPKSPPPPAVPKKIPGVLGPDDETERYLTSEEFFNLLKEDGNQGKQKLTLAAALKDDALKDSDDDSPDLKSIGSDEEDPENPLGDNYFAQADYQATSSPPENASLKNPFDVSEDLPEGLE